MSMLTYQTLRNVRIDEVQKLYTNVSGWKCKWNLCYHGHHSYDVSSYMEISDQSVLQKRFCFDKGTLAPKRTLKEL